MNRLACGSRALAAAARRAAFRHARFLLLALALAAPPLAARDWFFDDPSHLLCAGIGTVELFDSGKALAWHAEFRPAWHFRHLRPWLFCGTGNHDCFYAALGILVDLRLGEQRHLTAEFTVQQVYLVEQVPNGPWEVAAEYPLGVAPPPSPQT